MLSGMQYSGSGSAGTISRWAKAGRTAAHECSVPCPDWARCSFCGMAHCPIRVPGECGRFCGKSVEEVLQSAHCQVHPACLS